MILPALLLRVLAAAPEQTPAAEGIACDDGPGAEIVEHASHPAAFAQYQEYTLPLAARHA